MTVEWIEKDGKKWQILYGFGRIQRARSIYAKHLPDSIRRAQIANPDISDADLMKKATPQDLLAYNEFVGREICELVLNEATDWDKASVPVKEYVDSHLPEDIGFEIIERVRRAVAASSLSPDEKKT